MFQTGFRNNHKQRDCQTKLDFDVKGEIRELPCLLKKNKAVEQATVKVSRPQTLKFILLVSAPVVPPSKGSELTLTVDSVNILHRSGQREVLV